MSTIDTYAAIDAVNWSTLKALRESAAHYRHALEVPRPDTTALALGRLAHTLIFEPILFADRFAIWEGGDRRGKAWQEFAEAHSDRTIFKPNEVDDIVNMAAAVRSHPLVAPYFEGAEFEQPATWIDPTTGLKCKARTDWTIRSRRILLDFKSTRSTHGRQFGYEASRYGYHLQMAHYLNGMRYGADWDPQQVLIVAAEKKAPYDVAVFEIDRETLMIADTEVTDLLVQLKTHREADTWPGRYESIQALQLPAWVYTDDDEAADLGLQIGE